MTSTNGHRPERAVLYTRVSTDEQARSGYSLAQQLEALREYAAREGYEVLEEVQDPGQSGARLERPGMDRVRDLVASGGVSVVLAQDRDRFAREPAYHFLLRREFEEHGTKIRALNDRGDDTPEGELTDGILDQLAKYERAKIAERTRRGKLRRAREGKVLPVSRPNYGFKYNAARDNFVVSEAEMRVVARIVRMVGVEGSSINAVKRTFERECLPTPEGKRTWVKSFIRGCVLDDVCRPHTFEEVKELVTPEVAARLDPGKRYGVWWFNRERFTRTQVAEDGAEGRRYRRRTTKTTKPKEEWIAVPVPDSGIPREWVDAAREAVANNERTSRNGGRFWELSGGILRCASCGWSMKTTTVRAGNSDKRNHYYRCTKLNNGGGDCLNRKVHRAERLEPLVWAFVSGLLKDPERLREGLERMMEEEKTGTRGDPERETNAWLEKLAEAERKRSGFQDMAAEGLITLDELRAKLAVLEEDREFARRELEALEGRRARLLELERDKDELLAHYASMVPEALDDLAPEERHRVYKLLKLRVGLQPDGILEVSGVLGEAPSDCKTDTLQPSNRSASCTVGPPWFWRRRSPASEPTTS
jgi:site-specific DNA recombinase